MQTQCQRKAEPKTPHFLSLNQDVVARPQDAKCGLKYVIHSLGKTEGGAYDIDSASCDKSDLTSKDSIW